MGDEHHGEVAFLPQPDEVGIEPVAGDFVERAERLVHEHQFGLIHQGTRQRRPHAHAAREFTRPLSCGTGKPHGIQRLVNALIRCNTFVAGEVERQPHICAHRGPGHQCRVLEHKA